MEQLPVLSCILDTGYWCELRKQLEALRKDSSGFINPIFHLLLEKDKYNNFIKIKQLDEYLGLIFRHAKQKDSNYIKKELQSFDRINSLNMLYEINVLGYLLDRFPENKIRIYPKTISEKNVDAKINLGGRDVYVEISVLGDSDFTTENITMALRSGKRFSILPQPDEEKDKRRIRARIEEKEKQFISQKPNVLILFMVGVGIESIPAFGLLERAIEQDPLKNIGLIIEFDRQRLIKLHKDDCDSECFLTEDEEKYMKNLFSYENFETLVYSLN